MPQQTHGTPGSWRGGQASEEATSPTLLRFLFTVVVLALAALLIHTIWKLFQSPRTLLGVVPISYSTDLPQNPVGERQQELFKTLAEEVPSIEYENWLRFQSAAAGGLDGGIATEIANWEPPVKKRDTLIIYVSAHGIVRDGTAYLLHDDFNLSARDWSKQAAVVPVAELFDELQACPADVKLVVLDSGRIAYDSRMGVLINDFPRQLAAEVARLEDERLFVLLGNSVFESTAGMESPVPSPLAHYLVEGLRGAADRNPTNRQIHLDELYRFVWNETKSAFGGDSEYTQTPILLQGGVGVVRPQTTQLASFRIVSGLRKPAPPDEKEEDKEEAGADNESDADAGDGKSDDAGGQEKQAGRRPATQAVSWFSTGLGVNSLALQQTSGSSAADAEPNAGGSAESANNQAGSDTDAPAAATEDAKSEDSLSVERPSAAESGSAEKADRVEAVEGEPNSPFVQLDAAWQAWQTLLDFPNGPVDFAPHLCRRIEFELLRSDTELRLAPGNSERQTEAAERAADFELLAKMLATKGRQKATFSSALRSVLTELAESAQKYSRSAVQNSRPKAAESLQLVRQADTEVNHALYRIRSYLAWQAIVRTDRFLQTSGVIGGYLEALARIESKSRTLTVKLEDDLKRDLRELRKTETEIRIQIEQEVSGALQSVDLVKPKRIGELLRLSCLTLDQRKRLRQALLGISLPPRRVANYENPPKPDLETIPAIQADRLQALVGLELRAIEIATHGDDETVTRLREILNQGNSWKKFADLGAGLSAWYLGLPGELQTASTTNGPLPVRYRGLLTLVDPRDVVSANNFQSLWLSPEPRLEPRAARPRLQLVDDSQSWDLTTKFNQQSVLFSTRDVPPGSIELAVDYPADKLQVQYAGRALPSGSWRKLTGNAGREVSLQVRAQSESAGSSAEVTVWLRSGTTKDDRQVHCRLPQPNLVELVVQRLGSSEKIGPNQDRDVFELRCFPNSPQRKQPRTTEFALSLKNVSGGRKTIDVQLIRLPKSAGASWGPGLVGRNHQVARETRVAVFVDGDSSQGLKPSLQGAIVATAADVLLETGATEPIVLTPQATSAPAEGAETPLPPANNDTSYGFLCLLTNKERPTEQWLQWLEVQPLHPREYLDVEVVYRDGAIETSLAVKDEFNHGSRPPWTQDLPGIVNWEGELEKTLVRSSTRKLISSPIAARGQDVFVQLSIDGYPRAFIFKVVCRQNTRPVDNPEVMQGGRVHRVTALRSVPPGESSEPEVSRLIGPSRSRVIFPNCNDLRVEFAVDVPTNTFNHPYQNGDGIRLLVDGKKIVAGPYYADRRIRTQMVSCEGNLTLATTVSDYQQLIGGPTALNRDMLLETKLPSVCEIAIDPIQVFVDTEAPTIRRRQTPRALRQGIPLEFTVEADDRGELDRLELVMVKQDGVALPPGKPRIENLSGEHQLLQLKRATDKLQARSSYTMGLRVYDSAGNEGLDEFTFNLLDPLPPPTEADEEEAKKGNITGSVLDFQKNPVNGRWTLRLVLDKQVVYQLKHGQILPQAKFANGQFEFQDLKPGAYTLEVVNHDRAYPKGDKLEGIKPDPPGGEQKNVLNAKKENLAKFKNANG